VTKAQIEWRDPLVPVPETVFITCGIEELFNNYSLIGRYNTSKDLVENIRGAKKENRDMIHRIDKAVSQLKRADTAEEIAKVRLDPEFLHLDTAYLSEALGRIVVFKEHKWLAKIIYSVDKFGKNYSASISSPLFETEEGYGFVTISSKNFVKKIIVAALAYLLEILNRDHKFVSSELIDYPDVAWSEDDSYSLGDLVKDKHRLDSEREFLQKLHPDKEPIDVTKLPSKEEIIEQTRMMKEYEDSVVAAQTTKNGIQSGSITPIIQNPQIGE
jgi:hypothetical protein